MKTPNSEYKVKLILSALLLFCFSIYGKAQSAPKKFVAPSPERFQAINDSILVECCYILMKNWRGKLLILL